MQNIATINNNKYNCAGCTACQHACPQNCIMMDEDLEGFLYPIVDENQCIECGACVKTCPWLKEYPKKSELYPIVYACKHKSDNVRHDSTSGGVFTALAAHVISLRGVVYGAMFVSEAQRVEHRPITEEADLYLLRGSKYVQSYLGNTFSEVAKYLSKM